MENKPRVPVVVFRNTKPQAIGSRIEFNSNGNYKIKDFPIVMSFSKKASVDALIKSLQGVKELINE